MSETPDVQKDTASKQSPADSIADNTKSRTANCLAVTVCPAVEPEREPLCKQVPLTGLIGLFLLLGTTMFGGMLAGTQKLEQELVDRRGWLTAQELQAIIIAATLIPSPKFVGLAAQVKYRLNGWKGSVVSVLALLLPGSLMVLLAAVLLSPELLAGPLRPLQRAIGVAIVGVLFGNAYHQLQSGKYKGRDKTVGIIIAIAVAAAAMAGIPLLIAAGVGFAAGIYFIGKRGGRSQDGA
ncbi:chromate transporter [Paenibacillus thalictri]|uniref:Chromate transporter n=1 Tax=Paenibacillus thalictri TaxID=2527873 RepID=A0A4Q9DZF8_9BACL|nr:chromate transporter [Paenibacillus thalictri]TBL81233.1 chromate transporter [Paenibacillus thalictri]